MRKIFLLAGSIALYLAAWSQDYLAGKLTTAEGPAEEIYYDRTQLVNTVNVFQTAYKVFNKDKEQLFTVTVTHDKNKALFFVTLKLQEGESKNFSFSYNRQVCGLIFSDMGSLDTAYNINGPNTYLFSFADALRDYPILHKLKIDAENFIVLDPLTRIRLKKHNETLAKLPKAQKQNEMAQAKPPAQKIAEDNFFSGMVTGTFTGTLLQARESFYQLNQQLNDSINTIKNIINDDFARYVRGRTIKRSEKFYEGAKKNGVYEGRGLLVTLGDIYDGYFTKGKFDSGMVAIRGEMFEYFGGFKHSAYSGVGCIKYDTATFLVGTFTNGGVKTGIMHSTTADKEVYFGNFTSGQRNDYGELKNANGDSFYGFFSNGKLLNGYSRETDPFGNTTYFKFKDGVKNAISVSEAAAFFDVVSNSKN